jgi:hypothetical protein
MSSLWLGLRLSLPQYGQSNLLMKPNSSNSRFAGRFLFCGLLFEGMDAEGFWLCPWKEEAFWLSIHAFLRV